MPRLRSPRDMVAGLMFMAFGAFGLWFQTYPVGTAARMGPGYLPTMLSYGMLILGGIIAGKALLIGGERIGRGLWRPIAVVLAAVVAFALLVERGGLASAALVTVAVAAFAAHTARPVEVAVLSVL